MQIVIAAVAGLASAILAHFDDPPARMLAEHLAFLASCRKWWLEVNFVAWQDKDSSCLICRATLLL